MRWAMALWCSGGMVGIAGLVRVMTCGLGGGKFNCFRAVPVCVAVGGLRMNDPAEAVGGH